MVVCVHTRHYASKCALDSIKQCVGAFVAMTVYVYKRRYGCVCVGVALAMCESKRRFDSVCT